MGKNVLARRLRRFGRIVYVARAIFPVLDQLFLAEDVEDVVAGVKAREDRRVGAGNTGGHLVERAIATGGNDDPSGTDASVGEFQIAHRCFEGIGAEFL